MAVSKHATCGSSGARASTARIAARLWGRCSGAIGTSFSTSASKTASTRVGITYRAAPWATR